jgi:hypothetical protein
MEEQDSLDKANKMIERLKLSKELYQEYSKQFSERYCIQGKSMGDWRRYFQIQVPPDLNPRTAQHLALRLMELYQEASGYKTDAELRLHSAQSTTKSMTRDKYNALLIEYKNSASKIPAAATLNTQAEASCGKELDSLIHIEIELTFWKGILNSLQECRKLVETATWNLSVEAKAIGHEGRMDSLGKED